MRSISHHLGVSLRAFGHLAVWLNRLARDGSFLGDESYWQSPGAKSLVTYAQLIPEEAASDDFVTLADGLPDINSEGMDWTLKPWELNILMAILRLALYGRHLSSDKRDDGIQRLVTLNSNDELQKVNGTVYEIYVYFLLSQCGFKTQFTESNARWDIELLDCCAYIECKDCSSTKDASEDLAAALRAARIRGNDGLKKFSSAHGEPYWLSFCFADLPESLGRKVNKLAIAESNVDIDLFNNRGDQRVNLTDPNRVIFTSFDCLSLNVQELQLMESVVIGINPHGLAERKELLEFYGRIIKTLSDPKPDSNMKYGGGKR